MVEIDSCAAIQSSVPPEDLLQLPVQNCYRLVVLGSARVGKSSIVNRFLNNKFSDTYTPTIENFHRKIYRIKGESYQLDVLDTSGNHPFPAMRRLSFITGDLFVLVFSVDSRESFEEVLRLRDQIIETKLHMTGSSSSGSSTSSGTAIASSSGSRKTTKTPVNIVIAGNKSDKEMRTVTTEEAQLVCSSSCSFVETSAKKNLNVDELFRVLFHNAGLPPEMAPNCHRRIQPGQAVMAPGSQTPSKQSHRFQGFSKISLRRRLSDAYGVVAPNVRRPSLRTDLLIMRNKTGNPAVAASRISSPRSTSCHGTTCVIQ